MLTLFVLILLLRRAEAGEGSECTSQEYPVTVRVLLDSWRHQTLLSDNGSAVWTTYSGAGMSQGSTWTQSGECGESSVSVCSGAEVRVLETQNISKNLPATDTYQVRVFVNITYSANCSTSDCGGSVHLRVKDSGNRTAVSVMLDDVLKQNDVVPEKQFYFGLRPNETEQFWLLLVIPPDSGCVRVSRVLVYRLECPGHQLEPTGLVLRPSTQAPATGKIHVTPECSDNAHHAEGSRPEELECRTDGMWINDQTNCQCNEGFYREGTVCRAITISPGNTSYQVSEDQGNVTVCFSSVRATNQTFQIMTREGTAISNFDYVPVETDVSFSKDAGLTQCVEIAIVSDGLSEADEQFHVNVLNGSEIVSSAVVMISNNTGSTRCTEGRVAVVRDADNGSLQLVEMCQSQGAWSPLCDYDWTSEDATVVCRELGHSSIANMMIPEIGSNNKDMINCSGSEARLTDCPSSQASFFQPCSYLLVECVDTPPSVVPSPATVASGTPETETPTASVASGTPLSVVPSPATVTSATPQTETPTASVVSSPEVTGPRSTSEDRAPPLAVIATAGVVGVAIVAAATLLLALLIAVLRKRNQLKTQEKHQSKHLSNPVYDTAIQGAVVKTSSSSEGREGDKQEDEESTTLYNPLYTLPSGVPNRAQNGGPNGNGITHSTFQYEDPEDPAYSVPKLSATIYETPTVSSPSSSSQGPSPPPPHDYDYATVPPHTDPEYAPLEQVGTRPSPDGFGGAPVVYHSLEPPECTVTYHVLEPPASPADLGAADSKISEVGEEGGDCGQNHEYSTLQHD